MRRRRRDARERCRDTVESPSPGRPAFVARESGRNAFFSFFLRRQATNWWKPSDRSSSGLGVPPITGLGPPCVHGRRVAVPFAAAKVAGDGSAGVPQTDDEAETRLRYKGCRPARIGSSKLVQHKLPRACSRQPPAVLSYRRATVVVCKQNGDVEKSGLRLSSCSWRLRCVDPFRRGRCGSKRCCRVFSPTSALTTRTRIKFWTRIITGTVERMP